MPTRTRRKDLGIVIACIAGGFGIISPIIAHFVNRSADITIFNSIPRDRRIAVAGDWVGTVTQNFHDHEVTCPADLHIVVQGRILEGRFHTKLEDAGKVYETSFDGTGGFFHDRFMKLDYSSTTLGAVHFGTMYLELSPDGSNLSGVASGYGAHSQKLVTASLVFRKRP